MAIHDITRILLLRGDAADLPLKLADGEIAFTTDDGRLFIGFSGDPEISARDTFPYSNLEILTENSIEVFTEMHGARMRLGGGLDYHSSVLNPTGDEWGSVQVLRDSTWLNFVIPDVDTVTAFIDYAAYTNDGVPVRIGKMTLRHYRDNEAEPFLEDHMVAGRDPLALNGYDTTQVFQQVDFRFRVAGPLTAPFLQFEYRNPLEDAVNLRFKVSRPRAHYYEVSQLPTRVYSDEMIAPLVISATITATI